MEPSGTGGMYGGSSAFAVETQLDGSRAVIRISGDVDAETAPELRAVVRDLLDRRPKTIFLDLREVEIISSVGLQVLIWADMECSRLATRLVLRDPSQPVMRVLEIAGLLERFRLDVASMASARRRWEEAARALESWVKLQKERPLTPEETEQMELAVLAEREWWLTCQVRQPDLLHLEDQ